MAKTMAVAQSDAAEQAAVTGVNNMSYQQAAVLLNTLASQATGKATITPTNTSEFISVAQTALLNGYDPLINSISQVLSRSIFSIRPYYEKMVSIQADQIRFGNHVRKVNISDSEWETDQRQLLVDGESVDMYVVKKPTILQTNFYGANVYQRHYSIYKDQLDVAFTTPDEFMRFMAMVTQNVADLIAQGRENTARATVANFIAGRIAEANGNRMVKVVTAYNNRFNTTLTPAQAMDADHYQHFAAWLFGFLNTLSRKLTERTTGIYNTNITGKEVARHTPVSLQRVFMYAPFIDMVNAEVRSALYNQQFLRQAVTEAVNYWQAFNNPDQISLTPAWLKPDGSVDQSTAVTQGGVLGVIFDQEALGYTSVNQWSAPTPFNAAGGYSNVFFHWTDRFWNDFTENGVVLLLS